MSQPAISRHLKVLERAGLISMDVDAQRRPRKLEPKRLEEAVDWIERYREIFERNYQRLAYQARTRAEMAGLRWLGYAGVRHGCPRRR
jgi:DNA-binding transcriptional ArsR family regulator